MSDLEFRLISAFTRSLPPIKGAGTVANALARFYVRRPRELIEEINDGIRYELAPGESANQVGLLFFPRLLDRAEHRFISRTLKPGGVFVDIGSHVGSFTLPAAKRAGKAGRVLAVEAFPQTYKRLLRNLELNHLENVTAYNLGVSDKSETLKLGIKHGNSGAHSFLRPDSHSVDVECLPLLEIIGKAGLDRIDILKIDVEGFETRVLQKYFSEAPRALFPAFIVMEHGRKYTAEGDPIQLALSNGYKVLQRIGINFILEHESR